MLSTVSLFLMFLLANYQQLIEGRYGRICTTCLVVSDVYFTKHCMISELLHDKHH